ncbi:MAG TPA: UbiD family decarboxylase, partial [Alphaproteobacteria bacterium]|nr:UbiD family decarboxylase [Alphaproteobacteria bacterium]
MNVLQPIPGSHRAGAVDVERFRLRRFLDELRAAGDLDVTSDPIELGDVAAKVDGNRKAVLFERAGAEGLALAGNVIGSRERLARAFGVSPREVLHEILRRLKTEGEIVELSRDEAPVQQVVLEGERADLTKLPINLQHALDGGPYISAAMDFARDPKTGWTNVGLRRCILRGKRETGIDLLSPSDLRNIYLDSLARKERLPVSIVVGAHPIDYFTATMRLPIDELKLMSMLRAAPLPVVKCATNDLFVPADAEWVIEGYLDEDGYREPEGPFGEFLGYYGHVKVNPVFHVTAITRRHDAVFQTISISGKAMSRTDTAQLSAHRTEVLVWKALELAVREPLDVFASAPTGGVYNVRIAIRQKAPGEARNAIAAAFGSLANVKNVFVVDPDVDIFSDEEMDWALGTRFQGDRDYVFASDMRCLPLDPSLQGAKVGAKAGFDLTMPFGRAGRLETETPSPPTYQGKRFPSVEAALKDGPKFFEELMAAIGT